MDKIIKNIQVPIPINKAFFKFVNELHEWWPKEYTWSQQNLKQIKIEPKKSGLCTEIGPYNFRCDWGRITEFEENEKISLKWQISPQRVPEPNPDKSSDIKIKFKSKSDSETKIEFEHANFQNHGQGSIEYQKAMNSEQGWNYILNKYMEYCKNEGFTLQNSKLSPLKIKQMKAISLVPGTTKVSVKEVEEPTVQHPDEIKMKVLQVGICGTDREQAIGGRADAPPNKTELIIGHEMFGQVIETGNAVKAAKKGDYGVFTVRRGCGKCTPCKNNRSDMCLTGDYIERGIKAADGFQSEFVVDQEQYFVKVPDDIKEIGILTEPMSVASKAIDEAMIIQKARTKDFDDAPKWFEGKTALVAGIGAVGLLAVFALRLRGAEVYGLDIVDEDTLRPEILKQIGGKYVDGRKVETIDLDDEFGEFDFIFESAGFAELQIELIDALGINGIYVSTGIPGRNIPISIDGADLMRQLVLKNQIVLGSVNASMEHFEIAVSDLQGSKKKWPEAIEKMVTEHYPYSAFKAALAHSSPEEIKVVVEWD